MTRHTREYTPHLGLDRSGRLPRQDARPRDHCQLGGPHQPDQVGWLGGDDPEANGRLIVQPERELLAHAHRSDLVEHLRLDVLRVQLDHLPLVHVSGLYFHLSKYDTRLVVHISGLYFHLSKYDTRLVVHISGLYFHLSKCDTDLVVHISGIYFHLSKYDTDLVVHISGLYFHLSKYDTRLVVHISGLYFHLSKYDTRLVVHISGLYFHLERTKHTKSTTRA
jgi:hypothetical protein